MHILRDLNYGFRNLRKTPGFTIAAILSLALGIGANTVILSLINAIWFKPLSVEQPDGLVRVGLQTPKDLGYGFSYPTFEHLRNNSQSLTSLIAWGRRPLQMAANDNAKQVNGVLVSDNYFSSLGVNAAMGRTFGGANTDEAVAVISYPFWERSLGKDMEVIGRNITLNGVPFTIVGVTGPGFIGLDFGIVPDVWVPVALQPRLMDQRPWLTSATTSWLNLMGRLKPGVSVDAAQAELTSLFQTFHLEAEGKASGEERLARIRQETIKLPDANKLIARFSPMFWTYLYILMAGGGLTLLIACANIANLLLARARARRGEIAIRLSLGASRRRLITQLLTESLLLAVIGGALGILLAKWSHDALLGQIFTSSVAMHAPVDLQVLLFTTALCFVTVLLFGLAPSLIASKQEIASALRESARLSQAGSGLSFHRVMVISQAAISVLLLIGTGLLVGSFYNLQGIDTGFRTNNTLLIQIDPSQAGFKKTALKATQTELVDKIAALPGVERASFSYFAPLTSGLIKTAGYRVLGPRQREVGGLEMHPVGPGYFETTGIPLLAGRTITPQDNEQSPKVVVVNEAFVTAHFSDENPIGARLNYPPFKAEDEMEIIGVVGSAKLHILREEEFPMIYAPYHQLPLSDWGPMSVIVHTAGDPEALMSPVRVVLGTVSNQMPIIQMKTMETHVEDSLTVERNISILTTVFGLFALLLSAVGIGGVVSYIVRCRTREMGIRIALGAQKGDILRLVFREVVMMVVIGVAVGVVAALASTRLISSVLYGVTPTDPLTITIAVAVVVAVAMIAAYPPARRASHTDPMSVLRHE
ncbi:MAG TPA: ABC transporter permease [Blastocatellia bacterium]|nr:ABC transporter permease [Blastocatellia bacterium]